MGFIIKIPGMTFSNEHQLKKLLKKSLFLASEARKVGIHPSRLSYYVKIKLIERMGRGVYRGIHSAVNTDFQWEDLVLTVKSIPKGIVCLVSALAVYDLTEEIPRQYWIAIPHATTAPKRDNTRFVRMRDMRTGKRRIKLGEETIVIFNQERTIIDAFRYLSKEVAIKALKEAVSAKRQRKFDIKKFEKYAKKFKLNLTPYILMVTT